MFNYRKKPVVIQAVQHFSNMGTETNAIPHWLIEAALNGTIYAKDSSTYIKTLEGDHIVSDGDWIIQGVRGELYPCKPVIFDMTYDKVD